MLCLTSQSGQQEAEKLGSPEIEVEGVRQGEIVRHIVDA